MEYHTVLDPGAKFPNETSRAEPSRDHRYWAGAGIGLSKGMCQGLPSPGTKSTVSL